MITSKSGTLLGPLWKVAEKIRFYSVSTAPVGLVIPEYREWVVTTTRHWGEHPAGEWKLFVENAISGISEERLLSSFNWWSIQFYGYGDISTSDSIADSVIAPTLPSPSPVPTSNPSSMPTSISFSTTPSTYTPSPFIKTEEPSLPSPLPTPVLKPTPIPTPTPTPKDPTSLCCWYATPDFSNYRCECGIASSCGRIHNFVLLQETELSCDRCSSQFCS
jgi:hypothetical protein